jgi:predicted ATPase/DNA-binding SARP family transcriptional activator/Tfp pilus assembly protein PilF
MPSTRTSADPIRHNLPTAQTSFIGCEPAIATIKELLTTTRVLTLTGSGGSGKTRLALCVAHETLADYPGGVGWVDLAPLADPALVPQMVADALRLREQPNRSFVELLTDHLCDHKTLLVLDNCEHLRAACAELLTALLQAGALGHVLATSREPLSVVGEQVWPVPMLSVPAANGYHAATPARLAELRQSEAVRLFDERARSVAPSFTLNAQNAEAVAQICRRLDGMPLAIELAAARVNVLVPKQIVERLDNSVHLLTRGVHTDQSRHQTLRAALDWSFDLLASTEQIFFTRMAVFAGTFGVDAVESICAGQGLERDELLDLLANLVEKSLVLATAHATEHDQEMRYRLLVPVRHYAAERLAAAGEEPRWRARHAAWYLALAQRAEPELEGPDQAAWLERLENEHDDLRAALTWYAAAPDGSEPGLHLCSAIGLFWCIRSYLSEGQRWLETFMRQIDANAAPQAQVKAHTFLARIAMLQSNFPAARAHYERGLTLARQIEYDEGVETTMIGLGVILWELGDFQQARTHLEEAMRYSRSVRHEQALARALNNLGLVCMHQGDGKAARVHLEECLEINQRLGHKTGIATALFNLALLAAHSGDFTRARMLYQDALVIDRELGNRSTMADVMNNLGAIAVSLGEFAVATTSFQEAEQIYRELGATGDTAYTGTGLGDVAFYRAEYDVARAYYQEALALFREASNQRLIARVLGQLGRIECRQGNLAAAATLCAEGLTLRAKMGHKAGMVFILDQGFVEVALAAGQPLIAARILGAIDRARQELSRPRDPVETHQLEPLLAHMQAQLGDAAFKAAWAEGEAMSLEEVTAYALDNLSAATVVEARPELRVYALGQARVYRGDHLLTSADWTYAKARELFFYLLCRPSATREQIGLEFWPDASAEQVRKRFSAALAHARKALGRPVEWIIIEEGHYCIASERAYWFDVEVFESKLQAAKLLLHSDKPRQQAVPLLEEAINLYRGEFVEEFLEGEWHQPRRATLLRAYLDALLTLGGLHAEAGRTTQAIAVYQQALTKDAYLEEAHHELIRAYARLNKRSQALRQYETLTAALAELNATPAAETQMLIERLRLGGPL